MRSSLPRASRSHRSGHPSPRSTARSSGSPGPPALPSRSRARARTSWPWPRRQKRRRARPSRSPIPWIRRSRALRDHAIDIMAGVEKSVAATKTFVNSAVAGLALMAHCTATGAARRPRRTSGHFRSHRMRLDGPCEALGGGGSLFILGRGPSFAIANEAALKFKETCGMHAEAYSAAEVMHGPLALVRPGFPVLALAARDRSEPSMAEAADLLRGKEAAVFITTDLAKKASAPAFCRHRPSAHRSSCAHRVVLCFRRGFCPAPWPQPGRAAESQKSDRDPMSDLTAFLSATGFSTARHGIDGAAWSSAKAASTVLSQAAQFLPAHGQCALRAGSWRPASSTCRSTAAAA